MNYIRDLSIAACTCLHPK